jgi:sortase A
VLDEILAYEVDQIKVVEPDDISDIFIEEGEDYVTLVTCTPYGINSHRLLVRGTRVPYTEEKKEHQVKRQEESTWKQAYKEAIAEGVKWTLVGLAILAVLAGAGHLIGKAKKKSDKKKKGGSSA